MGGLEGLESTLNIMVEDSIPGGYIKTFHSLGVDIDHDISNISVLLCSYLVHYNLWQYKRLIFSCFREATGFSLNLCRFIHKTSTIVYFDTHYSSPKKIGAKNTYNNSSPKKLLEL